MRLPEFVDESYEILLLLRFALRGVLTDALLHVLRRVFSPLVLPP